jgi:XTP/dITP diphosphohydrolase
LVLYKQDGSYDFFEAKWPGLIIDEGRGNNGFGYDPIFLVPEMNLTAAELPAAIKNKISHRGQAFAQLKSHLSKELRNKNIGA